MKPADVIIGRRYLTRLSGRLRVVEVRAVVRQYASGPELFEVFNPDAPERKLALRSGAALRSIAAPEPNYIACTDELLQQLATHANTPRVRAAAGDALRARQQAAQPAVCKHANLAMHCQQCTLAQLHAISNAHDGAESDWDEAHYYRTAYHQLVDAVRAAIKDDCYDGLQRLVEEQSE
jgi:hypothetical protein